MNQPRARTMAQQITGCSVVLTDNPDGWYQHPGFIEIPRGKGRKEALIHEVCHWVVANDLERKEENLGMPKDPQVDQLSLSKVMRELREQQACFLQKILYAMDGREVPRNPSCRFRLMVPLGVDHSKWVFDRAREIGWEKLYVLVSRPW